MSSFEEFELVGKVDIPALTPLHSLPKLPDSLSVDKVDIDSLLKGISSLTHTVAALTKTVESMCKTQLKVLTELASLNDRLMHQDEREKNRMIRKWKKSGEASSFMSTSSKRYTVKKNTQPVSVLLEGL